MENNYNYVQETTEKQGSVIRGLIGAILGAIIGAVIWSLVAVATERIFSLIGLAVGFIVGYGYDLLKGRKGTIRMIIVLICVILSVVGGTAASYAWWLHDAYVEECEFIETATKQELAEAYLTAEELATLNGYPDALKQRVLDTFEVTMPTESEYFQLVLEDSELLSEFGGDCVSSIFFALLGSFALILNNGKKDKSDEHSGSVEFNEAALDMAHVNNEADAEESPAEEDENKEAQA